MEHMNPPQFPCLTQHSGRVHNQWLWRQGLRQGTCCRRTLQFRGHFHGHCLVSCCYPMGWWGPHGSLGQGTRQLHAWSSSLLGLWNWRGGCGTQGHWPVWSCSSQGWSHQCWGDLGRGTCGQCPLRCRDEQLHRNLGTLGLVTEWPL